MWSEQQKYEKYMIQKSEEKKTTRNRKQLFRMERNGKIKCNKITYKEREKYNILTWGKYIHCQCPSSVNLTQKKANTHTPIECLTSFPIKNRIKTHGIVVENVCTKVWM